MTDEPPRWNVSLMAAPEELAPVSPQPREEAAPPRPDFEDIFEAESTYVWNSLRHLGVREADLEDLTHDVLLTVYRRLEDYDPSRPIRPWLFGIALRVASRYRMKARHRFEVHDAYAEPIDGAMAADERAWLRQAGELAEVALEALPIERRALYLLHEIDGVAMPEIARALEIPLNTAYSRLRLARAEFQRALVELQQPKGDKP